MLKTSNANLSCIRSLILNGYSRCASTLPVTGRTTEVAAAEERHFARVLVGLLGVE